jgi:reactive intermediate/imine deaminase
MARQVIRPTNVHRPRGYSHAIKIDNTVYTSGQVPLDLDGNIVGEGDFVRQFEQALENMKNVLESADASMSDIVQMVMYITDLSQMQYTGDVFTKYFQRPYPPSVAVEVNRLGRPEWMIEIIATAVLD